MEYRLDLSTLLLMLGQSTGRLHAELPRLPKLKGRCRAFLWLVKGSISTCSIKNERGEEVVFGEAAIKLISHLVLEWQYTEERPPVGLSPTTVPRQQSVFAFSASIPRRTYAISQNDFMLWPRIYRSVYALVDGKTPAHHIVSLLNREQSAQEVFEALARLEERGLIAFDKDAPARSDS